MKRSDIKPGMLAMLSLGRRGSRAVTIVSLFTRAGYRTYDGSVKLRDPRWTCVDSAGNTYRVTPRALSRVPLLSASGEHIGHAVAPDPSYWTAALEACSV